MHLKARKLATPLVLVAVVLAAGVSAFLISRFAFSDDNTATAQPAPSGTPTIVEQPPTEAFLKVVEDSKKPRFVGELNGITFFAVASGPPKAVTPCTSANQRVVEGTEAAEASKSSALDFTPDYLPKGYRLDHQEAFVCGSAATGISRAYRDDKSETPISIGHSYRPAQFVANAPADRLEAATVGGRPAVIQKPVFEGDTTTIYMRGENDDVLGVSGDLPTDEVVKIAESLR